MDVCELSEVLADLYLVVLSVDFRKVLYVVSMLRKQLLDLLYQKCTCSPIWISRMAFMRLLRLSASWQASSYKKGRLCRDSFHSSLLLSFQYKLQVDHNAQPDLRQLSMDGYCSCFVCRHNQFSNPLLDPTSLKDQCPCICQLSLYTQV